jgi:hypothetical protein
MADEPAEAEDQFQRILTAVRAATGVNFSLYRDTMIKRRIMRRMALHGQQSLADYAGRLEQDGAEEPCEYLWGSGGLCLSGLRPTEHRGRCRHARLQTYQVRGRMGGGRPCLGMPRRYGGARGAPHGPHDPLWRELGSDVPGERERAG